MELDGQLIVHYRVIEKIGEGGMATVYLAQDEKLKRKVAIKVIRADKSSNQTYLKRFEREAKALAQLNHPNIVHINDYGEHDGILYLVMDYLAGGSLKQKLGKILSASEAARLLAPIAHALEYAHQKNIVHRDVKPANILLTESGQPMLSDFGIAKILELEETLDLTGTGMGLGTPDYMAPEQWMGNSEAATDQYALGVIFFEMVTGLKPYTADTPAAILVKHVNDEIPRPRKINRDIPEYVENVILKVLAKQPKDRFGTMGEFASVLEKLAAGQKVVVRNVVQQKSVTRQFIFGAAALGVLLLTSFAFLNFGKGFSGTATEVSTNILPETTSTHLPATQTATSEPTFTPSPSATIMPTLSYPLLAGTPIPTLENISLENADQIVEVARWGKGSIAGTAFSPDGQSIAVGTSLGVYLYTADNLTEKQYTPSVGIRKLLYSPDGNKLALLSGNKVKTLDLLTNEEKILYEGEGLFNLQYLANGKLLVLGMTGDKRSRTLQVVNVTEQTEPIKISVGADYIYGGYSGEITPKGDAVFISQIKGLTLYDLNTTKKIQTYFGYPSYSVIAISPNQRLMASDSDGKVLIWNVDSGQPVYIFSSENGVTHLEFSPDNKKILASMRSGLLQSWNLETGEKENSFSGHINWIDALSISPDGKRIISGSDDGSLILWAYPDGSRLADVPAGSMGVSSIDISPDGTVIATGANDSNITLWNRNTGQKLRNLAQLTTGSENNSKSCGNCSYYGVESLSFSLDGYSLAAGYGDPSIVWDVSSGKPIKEIKANTVTFCSNQPFLASITFGNDAVQFLDLATGAEIRKLSGKTCRVGAVTCSSDGSLLAYHCGGLKLMKLDNMVDLFEFRDENLAGLGLTFSPDGMLLAGGATDGIRLWNTQSGKEVPGPKTNQGIYPNLADFSPDGSMLAYLSDYNHLSLFDIENNKNVMTLEVNTSTFRAFRFSKDGKILVTGSSDGTIRLWGIKP